MNTSTLFNRYGFTQSYAMFSQRSRTVSGANNPKVQDNSDKTLQESAFGKYLDVDAQRQKMRDLPEGETLDSVFMQFMEDYRAWKSQQSDMTLPNSEGWTEENLAFLREHYSGELSAYEIYDILETMQAMGAISQSEKNHAVGSQLIALDASNLNGGISIGAGPDSKTAWLHGFDEAPIVGFHCLDDILSWVDTFRSEDHSDFITHAEAVTRGWI